MTRQAPDPVGELAARLLARWQAAGWPHQDLPAAEQADLAHAQAERITGGWTLLAPAEFANVNVADLTGAELEAVTEWRATPERNLVLLGGVGVGKTHTALAAARLAYEAGWRVRFWPVIELWDAAKPDRDPAVIDDATTTALLVLDDLGGEKVTDWTIERLYLIVNRRWLEHRPIIATSNLDPDTLEHLLGPRIMSRLTDNAIRLAIGGVDRRRRIA
jgi:DNA replication protein DnaC